MPDESWQRLVADVLRRVEADEEKRGRLRQRLRDDGSLALARGIYAQGNGTGAGRTLDRLARKAGQ